MDYSLHSLFKSRLNRQLVPSYVAPCNDKSFFPSLRAKRSNLGLSSKCITLPKTMDYSLHSPFKSRLNRQLVPRYVAPCNDKSFFPSLRAKRSNPGLTSKCITLPKTMDYSLHSPFKGRLDQGSYTVKEIIQSNLD